MRLIFAYAIGLVFGVGISFSGMANPAKVLNFFDVAGTWDPSLMFVMGGALVVTFIGYRLVLRQPQPLLDGVFQIPARKDIDVNLIGGAAIFGIGWGISGFCPGGALPALAGASRNAPRGRDLPLRIHRASVWGRGLGHGRRRALQLAAG